MRSTFSILPYINRNKVKADGTTSVMCRISIDGKSCVFSTGIYCRPEDWNTEKGEIREQRANNRLIELRNKLEQTYEKYLKTKGVVSAELLKNEITQANTVPEYLLQAGEEERERLRVRSVEIRSTSSYRQSKSTQAYLREYLLTLKMTDIAFEDITEDFGYGFKQFVKSKGCKASHINHCMTWLNRLIYIAVDREIDHDVGFQLNCSYGNGFRLTGNEAYKQVLYQGAKSLSTRFQPTAGVIRSWDFVRKGCDWKFPVIIDNMMNLELLLSMSKAYADDSLQNIACTHANTTILNHFRDDYSTYHLVDYDRSRM